MKPYILITGGSKGIGLAIARKFYAASFEVIVCARGQEALASARAEMPGLHTLVCDISDKDAVKALGRQVNQQFGPLAVLVNNGGVFRPGKVSEEADEVFELQMKTNLNSAYYLTKEVLPLMVAQGRGTIFNIGSVASIQAYPNGGSYSISKFALLGFSKALREEMKPHNVRVVSVLPGAVHTASWEGTDLPKDRFIPPEDIASLVWQTFQLSDRTVVEEILVRPAHGDI